ncbi:sigma-54 interaction domain-containing protein [Pseudoalteromonas xiamenensis]|uniref:sigma-54 interaction domain-containing protein n=1 Tax=Pseudoalteromonas xiamenensis TaxID=882626 RepID=UPI0035E4EC42
MNIATVQAMINAVEKPAIFIDTNYRILAVNLPYRELYETSIQIGYSRCYEISHHASEPCDKQGEQCPLSECKQTGKASSALHIHPTADGDAYCDIHMRPIVDDDGITIGFLEVLDKIEYASRHIGQAQMIGESDAFKAMLKLINRSGQTDINVLLCGETGTGKELAAKALHQASRRSSKPFVVVECTGLNENLFESELFGHEKGAFTGATQKKAGLVELAHGGTLFLDEIADVPMSMQVKLLRLLETGNFRSVGSTVYRNADFRLVCATHKDLLSLVKEGKFREDLYYRIAAFPIYLPALRERTQDIALLAKHLLEKSEFASKRLSNNALSQLQTGLFNGNIRELKHVILRAAIMSDDDEIHHVDFGPGITTAKPALAVHNDPNEFKSLLSLDEAEKQYLQYVVGSHTGSIEALSDVLGISTRSLYRRLKKFGISTT